MKRMVALMGLVAIAGFVMAGCEKGQALPEKPVEEEKTPEQIVELIKKDLAPLAAAAGGGYLSDEDKTALISKLRTHKTTWQAKPNGVIALDRITAEVEQAVRMARDAGRWRLVLICLDIYDVMQPGSTKYQRVKNTAELQMKKPRVKLTGFFGDNSSNDQIYAFVEITDPIANVTYNEQMRVGEEKHGIRFHRIIGNRQGVEFEYLAIPGDYFEVKK